MAANFSVAKMPQKQGINKILGFWWKGHKEFCPEYSSLDWLYFGKYITKDIAAQYEGKIKFFPKTPLRP